MGSGPLALAPSIEQALTESGYAVAVQRIDPTRSWHPEIEGAFEIQRGISHHVRTGLEREEFPLLLSGNCNATLGVLAALRSQPRRAGLVWFDAHADFNTPETTKTGFLDGQGLAMIVGRCWTQVTRSVPGFCPTPERDVILIGARDIGTLEGQALQESKITWLPPSAARNSDQLTAAVTALSQSVDTVHVHIDLDVHDPDSVAPANSYAALCGMHASEVLTAVDAIATHIPISSATVASYDPAHDKDGRMQQTALTLVNALVRTLS